MAENCMRHSSLLLAIPVLLLAACSGHDYSYSTHSGGRRGDDSKFTLSWVHREKSKETAEFLKLAIPYGPLGVSVDVAGKDVEAEFAHSEGRDYYDPPPGAKVTKYCDKEHPLQGSVVILSQGPGGIRAFLRVTATCPDKGRYDIEGEHSFESESVFYR